MDIKTKVFLPNADFTDNVLTEIIIKCLGFDQKTNDVMYRYDLPNRLYGKLVDTQTKFRSYQNYLKNKEEVKKRGVHSFNNEDELYLQKHITEKLISIIVGKINELTFESIAIGKRNTLARKKKIFVNFDSETRHNRCNWTGGYMGERVELGFQFFIGYEVEEQEGWLREKETVTNYYTLIKYATGSFAKQDTNFQEGDHLEPLHMADSKARNNFINNHHILDWSQEREDFFKNHILDKFKELDERLKNYFADLDNDKINLLMSSTNSQKLIS